MEKLNFIYFGSGLHHKHFKEYPLKPFLSNVWHNCLILPRNPVSYELLGLLLVTGINLSDNLIFIEPRKIINSPIGFNEGRAFTTIPEHELVFHEVAGNKLLMEWCP